MRLGHNDEFQQHYANLIVYISLAVGGNVFLMFQIPLLPLYHHYLSMFFRGSLRKDHKLPDSNNSTIDGQR